MDPTVNDRLTDILSGNRSSVSAPTRAAREMVATDPINHQAAVETVNDSWRRLKKLFDESRSEMETETSEFPIIRMVMRTLEIMVGEYERVDNQISDFVAAVDEADNFQERSKLRDDITQLVVERWRLLNSIIANLTAAHSALVRARSQNKGKVFDPFEELASSLEEDDQ